MSLVCGCWHEDGRGFFSLFPLSLTDTHRWFTTSAGAGGWVFPRWVSLACVINVSHVLRPDGDWLVSLANPGILQWDTPSAALPATEWRIHSPWKFEMTRLCRRHSPLHTTDTALIRNVLVFILRTCQLKTLCLHAAKCSECLKGFLAYLWTQMKEVRSLSGPETRVQSLYSGKHVACPPHYPSIYPFPRWKAGWLPGRSQLCLIKDNDV